MTPSAASEAVANELETASKHTIGEMSSRCITNLMCVSGSRGGELLDNLCSEVLPYGFAALAIVFAYPS